MEASLKKILKSVTLELRHLLEGRYDTAGVWQPGDLETRLASIGVRGDRDPRPADELRLTTEDQHARKVVDAYLKLREEAGVPRAEAVAEFLRETAYTWANRLIALRCMESRDLIDSVILQQEAYGGRSLEHHRLAQRQPELCAGEDDGLFAVLDKVFREQSERLPMLFDPQSPGIVLRPSPASIKDCFGLLSLNPETLRKYRIRIKEDENAYADAEPPNPFIAPDALGWTYQYWNSEEKDRVFEMVRTVKGAKISGADIVPATQLYTEDYMVKFLVQNSLGATWMGLRPESRLCEGWEYFVRDADRAPITGPKPVREITFLDPACGSGHFLLEAFDLFFAMYEEEGELSEPAEICNAILTQNLFGIDIDARAVQIAEAALWMRAAERTFDYSGAATNLVAATASHLKGSAWEEFLSGFEREPSVGRVLRQFAQTMEHIDEIGSLARPAEDLRDIIREEHATWERQIKAQKEANFLFPEMTEEALSGQLPFHEISDEEFGDRLFYRARASIDAFTQQAREDGEFADHFLGIETRAGFHLVAVLGGQYDIVAANPPYMHCSNFGPHLKEYVYSRFPNSSLDIYGTFVERSLELLKDHGMAGMVTQQSFMFLERHLSLRELLFAKSTPFILAHLGPHAFEDIGGEVVNVVLLILVASVNTRDGLFLDLTHQQPKRNFLKLASQNLYASATPLFRCTWHQFSLLPGKPIAYRLHTSEIAQFEGPSLESISDIPSGMVTGNNSRFVRYWWESPSNLTLYMKGGESKAWFGNNNFAINATVNGYARMRASRTFRAAGSEFYCRPGITYSSVSTLMRARFMEGGAIWDCGGPVVILKRESDIFWCLAMLNSAYSTQMLYSLNPTINIKTNDLKRLPLCDGAAREALNDIGSVATHVAELVESLSPRSRKYTPFVCRNVSVQGYVDARLIVELASMAVLSIIQDITDKTVFDATQLDDSLRAIYLRPFLSNPLIQGMECIPLEHISFALSARATELLKNAIGHETAVARSDTLIENIKHRFQDVSIVDSSEEEGDVTDDDVEQIDVSRIALKPDNFLEGIANDMGIHPISVFRVIESGVSNSQWRSRPFQESIAADLVTQVVFGLLGHRCRNADGMWGVDEELVDADGIIPLTPVVNEPTLSERVFKSLGVVDIDCSDFSDVTGKQFDVWLATEFFKYHTRQFKKRPITWQVQSGKFTARNSPAFACLLYYHKLDADTLQKIRSQYVGPLRQRMETELRGVESVAVEARSDRQEKRRLELTDAIKELTEFDGKLEQVIRAGFATKDSAKLFTDEPLDRWCSLDGTRPRPATTEEFVAQESSYAPDINDGVRVNIAPLQKAGLLAADVLAKKDVDKAIADRAQWRSDERRWVREGKLPQPGWWPEPEVKQKGSS